MPQIVFSFKEKALDELNTRLYELADYYTEHAREYCNSEVTFSLPAPDLFGRIEFGYGKCGFVTKTDGGIDLRIELGRGVRLYHSTLTIHLLTRAFRTFAESIEFSNRQQQLDLETLCDHKRSVGYGHAVGGYVWPALSSWLCRQGERLPDDYHRLPAPQEVLSAMQATWHTVTPRKLKKYASHCRGEIRQNGTFMLECFGNACDIAVYPDLIGNRKLDEEPTEFSCHNLDNAYQQITLLAGLAKMCELARAGEQN